MTTSKRTKTLEALTCIALLTGCGAAYGPDSEDWADPANSDEFDYGTTEQSVTAACGGDDSNALAAALAVAIGNELGRWDVNTDFELRSGKLELSATGQLHCGTGCQNITALLRLQDDASSVIKNHSPATYRSKLSSWYGTQKSKLDGLVSTMLKLDKGVYRIKNVSSGKYIVPQSGATSSGAAVQQSDQYTSTTAAQWRVVLNGTKHQLINIKSGLCMALGTNSNADQNMVQSPCNTANFSQGFNFADMDINVFAIRTAHLRSVAVSGSSTANNAAVVQNAFSGTQLNHRWMFEKVGTGHQPLLDVATAVYNITVQHTGMAIAPSSASLNDGVSVVQQAYSATDDRFHWYITKVDDTRYQFINRRNGSCLDLADPSSKTSALVQRKCSTSASQRFFLTPNGEGKQVLWSQNSVSVGVGSSSTASGAQLAQGGTTWTASNTMLFTPVTAGEPHRLKFNRKANGGPCGDYYWYDVSQPNSLPLDAPADTYVQLIFAGGKQTSTGADVNPFIAQQVNGNQVAIDPTYGLNDGSSTSSGACTAACLRVSTTNVAGQCCSCNGTTAKFAKSTWSAVTYVCQ